MKRKIKRFLGLLLNALIWMTSKVYPYSLSQRLKGYRNKLYSMWIGHFVGKIGEHSSIHYPCLLQGGGEKRIAIGDNTCIQSHSILGCWVKYGKNQTFTPEIVIGNHCSIGEYNQVTAINKITIGDGLLTGRYVYIGDNSHGGLSWEEVDLRPAKRQLKSKGEIIIGKNVWLGDKVTILGGVTIGNNVIVGSNTVVTHNIPDNSVVTGSQSRIVRSL